MSQDEEGALCSTNLILNQDHQLPPGTMPCASTHALSSGRQRVTAREATQGDIAINTSKSSEVDTLRGGTAPVLLYSVDQKASRTIALESDNVWNEGRRRRMA